MTTTPAVAYRTALFPAFYDAMVASLPPDFEVSESHSFYTTLALRLPPPQQNTPVKILDLCTGTGSIPRHIAAAWSSNEQTSHTPLHIVGVDNSEEMLRAATAAWTNSPNVSAEWRLATLGHPHALAGVEGADLAIISAGSFHHLTTRAEQIQAVSDVKHALGIGGTLVMNVFPEDEIIAEPSSNDLQIWHLSNGFWKQTVKKEVARVEDGGVTGRETFRIGREGRRGEEGVCEWTLRGVKWDDIRALCEEVGLAIEHEFRSFRDGLDSNPADRHETGTTGRVFVIRKPEQT